jgi:hypothetical protein
VHLLLQIEGFRMGAFGASIRRRLLLMDQQRCIARGIGAPAPCTRGKAWPYQFAGSGRRKGGYRRSFKSFFALIM